MVADQFCRRRTSPARAGRNRRWHGVKSKPQPLANQLPSQPGFQPSTSTPRNRWRRRSRCGCWVLAVVAPCRGPVAQVSVSRCSDHHTPTYLAGVNQLVAADGIGLVEVEHQAGFGQVAGALADLDRAPRRTERQRAHHRGVATAGRARRAARQGRRGPGSCPRSPAARPRGWPHAGRCHRAGSAESARCRSRAAGVGGTGIPRGSIRTPGSTRRSRRGRARTRSARRGCARLAHRRLSREPVAEADAVVVDAEHHVETAPGMGRVHRLSAKRARSSL